MCHHLMPGGVSRGMESVLCLIIQHSIQVLMSLQVEKKKEKAALSPFHQNRHERRKRALERSGMLAVV